MTQKQIVLVQHNWLQGAMLDAVLVGPLFYMRLFAYYPALKLLFKNTVPEQLQKLLQMIEKVVNRLDEWDDVVEDTQQIAQRHVGYGVKEKQYDQAGETLILILEKGLAGAWHKELEEAWVRCYAMLPFVMIDASQEAQPA